MKVVLTVMVRDEVDIIAAMVEHHLAQGVDTIIATDNGSEDGTAEILSRYADAGLVELHHDPVHRKQQGTVVTNMARRARTEHAADWVINADADEFWVPVDRSRSLKSVLEQIPLALNAFQVPVVNLVGPPANRGSGVDRLVWRDHRSDSQLQEIGIYAQPTDNCVHRGESDIVVSQGNHFVSLPSNGQPDAGLAIEVLHLPWRSWAQFEQKVVHAGRSYEANPELRPSKNHHGMADYRRHQAGRLRYAWALRQPLDDVFLDGEIRGQFQRDEWLRDRLSRLAGSAVFPDLLSVALDPAREDPVDPEHHRWEASLGATLQALEAERDAARREADGWHRERNQVARQRDKAIRQRDRAVKERDRARQQAPPESAAADLLRVGDHVGASIRARIRRALGSH